MKTDLGRYVGGAPRSTFQNHKMRWLARVSGVAMGVAAAGCLEPAPDPSKPIPWREAVPPPPANATASYLPSRHNPGHKPIESTTAPRREHTGRFI